MFQRFEKLRERLLRGGIAPRHVRRYVAELRDHFDDLVREGAEKGLTQNEAEAMAQARIGSDDELSAVMLARSELRSVTARFPWAVFGFGPALMLTVTIVAAVLLEGGFLYSHRALATWWRDAPPVTPPDWIKWSVYAWNWLATFAAPLMIAALLCVLGIRQRMSRRWIMLGAAVVCILGAFHQVDLTWSDLPGRSELAVGFGLAPPFPLHMILTGLVRAAINVALVGAAYCLWLRRISVQVAQ